MERLGVVITDGVGFRNFILSDFLLEAQKQFEEVTIFSCLPKSAYDGLNLRVIIIELAVFEESFTTWFFRKAKELAHFQKHKEGNFGITDNLNANYSKAKTPRGYATRFLFLATKYLCSEKWILQWEKGQQLTFTNNKITTNYQSLLEKHKITKLFFTHQRPPYIAPLILASKKLKISTSCFIFSWDNLASKGRMAGSFEHYLVWSDLMKKELLQFYSSIKENQVKIVGTPQFEPYTLSRYGLSKEEFCAKFHLDPNKKTILFSCGDVSTSPNDAIYIEAIADSIASDKLGESVNFIVRTSPAETPERFEELANKYPWISWNYPKWIQARSNHQENWSQRIPTIEDVTDLKSALQHCDVCINMLSTMSLDAMLFDKPVINTVFGNGKNGLVNDQRFLKYAHIEHVLRSEAVELVRNEEELAQAINYCLDQPNAKANERTNLIEQQISVGLESTSKRIVSSLQEKEI